jgi:hypothetical protein
VHLLLLTPFSLGIDIATRGQGKKFGNGQCAIRKKEQTQKVKISVRIQNLMHKVVKKHYKSFSCINLISSYMFFLIVF